MAASIQRAPPGGTTDLRPGPVQGPAADLPGAATVSGISRGFRAVSGSPEGGNAASLLLK